jgi:ubiquinone/menaquinone biosynthesis C-methylase UbiE
MTPGADPGVNAPFHQPDSERWNRILEQPGRELFDRRQAIVAALGLNPGMMVADVGAGTGLFTVPFAQAVGPEGRVYAVDVAAEFIDNIERRVRDQGLGNVVGIVNNQHSTLLPPQSLDLVFLADTYHHFEQPADMLRSIHGALRPGGELVVIDIQREPATSSPWVMHHVRAGRGQVIAEVELAGFRFTREEPILRGNFFLRFRKP